MSLTVYLTPDSNGLEVAMDFLRQHGQEHLADVVGSSYGENYSANITHNLAKMAGEVGLYAALWRPEELFKEPRARDLIPLLEKGLDKLTHLDQDRIKELSPPNGWGTYAGLVAFTNNYLDACKRMPGHLVEASR